MVFGGTKEIEMVKHGEVAAVFRKGKFELVTLAEAKMKGMG